MKLGQVLVRGQRICWNFWNEGWLAEHSDDRPGVDVANR